MECNFPYVRIWETPPDGILHCRWEARSFILDHTGFRESAGGHLDAVGKSQESRSAFAISQRRQQHQYILFSLPKSSPSDLLSLSLFRMICRVALDDVADVKPCMDPSLPAGHAFWVSLHSLPTGLYFVAGMPDDHPVHQNGMHTCSLVVSHIHRVHLALRPTCMYLRQCPPSRFKQSLASVSAIMSCLL